MQVFLNTDITKPCILPNIGPIFERHKHCQGILDMREDLKTTMTYTHVLNRKYKGAKNRYDDLQKRRLMQKQYIPDIPPSLRFS